MTLYARFAAHLDAILDALRAGRDPAGQSIPPHGTLSRVALPVPVTPADRERPEEIHPSAPASSA